MGHSAPTGSPTLVWAVAEAMAGAMPKAMARALTSALTLALAMALMTPPAAAERKTDFTDCQAQAPPAPLLTPDTGALVLRAELRAYTPLATPLGAARATLHGGDSFTGTVTSSAQCGELIVFPRLAPGRYRLAAVEGRVSAFTAQRGFLFEMPQDGYRIIAPRGAQERACCTACRCRASRHTGCRSHPARYATWACCGSTRSPAGASACSRGSTRPRRPHRCGTGWRDTIRGYPPPAEVSAGFRRTTPAAIPRSAVAARATGARCRRDRSAPPPPRPRPGPG